MNIRSITVFLNTGWPVDRRALVNAGELTAKAVPGLKKLGYEVQTVRLACVPFGQMIAGGSSETYVEMAIRLEEAALAQGFAYLSLGPALAGLGAVDARGDYEVIPDMLRATKSVFLSGALTLPGGGVSLPAVRACARIIRTLSTHDPHGFGNLYFAALANVEPWAPFFPAAYHGGGPPCFALATESADLAVTAFERARSLSDARRNLVQSVEENAARLSRQCETLAQDTGLAFKGLDFTLAPFPEERRSLGTALERLGVPAVGLNGSLAAAAFLTDALDRASYPRTGFNGLMLPVLEDATLARRAAEGVLSVNDLLLYSAVCGTGLDTVPLPGDVSEEALAAVLLDLAALSERLKKPLTARLMPVAEKKAGDPTGFDFPYFANSRILDLKAQPLSGLFSGDELFDFNPSNMRHHPDHG